MPPAVRLTGVARTYPGPPPVPALLPLHVTVERGDYVAIVGPSGSGKSTFLNVVGLLDTPTEGIYELDGIDVGALSERDRAALRGCRIGFVFQEFRLLSHRTATENVALAQLYNGTPRRDRMQAAAQALDQVGLSHRRQAVPSTLSGGERQRVAIARALVNRPSLRSPEVGRARLLKSCGFDSVDDRAWVAEHGRRVCVEFVGE
ncbi:MAG: ABC transporter ATP-binding protein [Acidimicrobiales bacterium]